MGVIRYRKTPLADPGTAWDGDAERKRATVADLRVMCAWYQAPGEDKGDYKLPHHKAMGENACVLAGVRSALQLLNATHMPDGDRPAVRAHLEQHLEDFGVKEEAEQMTGLENSRVSLQVEFDNVTVAHDVPLYEVAVITAGQGNGLEYGAELLRGSAHLFEGASVFVDHASMPELWSMTGNRSVRNILGVLEDAEFEDLSMGIYAHLRFYPGPDREWFTEMVNQYLADKAAGRAAPSVGLSAVLDVQTRGREVVSIGRVVSVDAVFDPARGGDFIRALNQRRRGGQEMPGEEQVTEGVTEGSVTATVAPAAPAQEGPADRTVGTVGLNNAASAEAQGLAPAERQALLSELVRLRLERVDLPAALKSQLGSGVSRFADLAGLDERIEAMQAAWAESVAVAGPQVRNVGQRSDVTVGLSEMDRLQAVMDQLCGLRPASEALQGIAPVSGIRELYLMLSGDYNFTGAFDRDRVALANVTTSTMTSLVKNAFNKVILDYFNAVDLWWRPIVSEENFNSMKDLTLITLGGFGNLPTVSEGAAYTELSWSDTEEVVSFVKKGAYVGVTLEMMDQDETRKFRVIPRKIAMAGYRTLSALVSALFTDNSGVGPYWPSSQSTYRLFDSNYSNLGSSALSASTWDACIQAMWQQAEATSSAVMGIRPAYLLVPIELEKTALTIMESAGEPGTADNDANVRRSSSRVIAVPEWTDADNWAAVADPNIWPGIVVGYRFGNVPEVFTAGEETVGSMFTNDEMRIKARFIVAVGVGDYRPLYKANV